MNDSRIDQLADAVLYEGFILYPYRPSIKNAHRWTFGGLYPSEFCQAQQSVESPAMQVQCLIVGGGDTRVEITIRFLRLIDRKIGRFARPLPAWPADEELVFERVHSLTVGDRQFHSWHEAAEERLVIDSVALAELASSPLKRSFTFSPCREREPIAGPDGGIVGLIERERYSLAGSAELAAEPVAESCFRVTLRAVNETRLPPAAPPDRYQASLRSFAAAHAIVAVHGGELVSQIDPPEQWRGLISANQNIGAWPVLVGEPPDCTTMLAAPIILYDYPQIAPESPTALFDATEIDEILMLRIMTLTDAEKQAMRAVDSRSRDLLARVESLSVEDLSQLHGATR